MKNPAKPLHLAILTQDIDNESCRQLKAAMEACGARVDFIQFANDKASDPSLSYHTQEAHGHKRLVKDGKALNIKQYDGVMLRTWGSEQAGHDALKLFADAGVTMANDHEDIAAADSKVKTFERFEQAGVTIPKTLIAHNQQTALQALKELPGFPIVIKRDIGSRGDGVFFAHNQNEATEITSKLFDEGEHQIVLQQFIRSGNRQKTYRLLVVDNKVIGAKELTAPEGELLTNGAKGGTSERVDPPQKIKDLAINAAKAMKVNITGVDIITDENGQGHVLEANDSPNISALTSEGIPAAEAAANSFLKTVNTKKTVRRR